MLYARAGSREAPHALHFLSRTHVPAHALAVSGAALGIGVSLNVVVPDDAFVYITSAATVAILWVWGMVVVAHLRYRGRLRRDSAPQGSFRMPGSPWTNYLVLVYLGLVAVLLAVAPDQRVAVFAGGIWAVFVGLGWWRVSRTRRRDAVPVAED